MQVTIRPPPPPTAERTVAALLKWLHERDAFATPEARISIGQALLNVLGEAGRDLWKSIAIGDWDSLPPGAATLQPWFDQAHEWGWRGPGRDGLGRFAPGNPGRPLGSRNR